MVLFRCVSSRLARLISASHMCGHDVRSNSFSIYIIFTLNPKENSRDDVDGFVDGAWSAVAKSTTTVDDEKKEEERRKIKCSHMKYLIYYLHYLRSSFLLLCLRTCHNHNVTYRLIAAWFVCSGVKSQRMAVACNKLTHRKMDFLPCEKHNSIIISTTPVHAMIEANKLNSNEGTKFIPISN